MTSAKVLRLDLYDGALHCVGTSPPTGLPAPIFSRTFAPGQKLTVDAPAGHHLVVVSAFADAGLNLLIGQACREAQLDAGGSLCLDLTLSPPADMSVSDSSLPDLSAADLYTPDLTPTDLFTPDLAPTDLCTGVVHSNGLGQPFVDCVALGTHNVTQANEAANVSTLGGTIFANTCGMVPNQTANVCNMAATSCACWGYADTGLNNGAGHVLLNTANATCKCPSVTDPSWN